MNNYDPNYNYGQNNNGYDQNGNNNGQNNNGYGQNGNNWYNAAPPETFWQAKREKHDIRTIGSAAGICVIAYVILQNVISIPILFSTNLNNLYNTSDVFLYAYTIISSILGLMLPFFIGGLYLKKQFNTEIFAFDSPVDMKTAALTIPIGLLICFIGDYIASLLITLFQYTGYELTMPDMGTPDTVSGKLMYVAAVAIVAPLTEEFAIRGCIMQPLRRYGDKFAIIASAVLFAVLHGNLVQAPFALIAGLGLGYICCVTNSLWPGIIVHFLNNLYSVILEFLSVDMSDEMLNKIYTICEIAVAVIGIVCYILFVQRRKGKKLEQSTTIIRDSEKAGAFICNIPMIIAIVIMLFVTSQYVSKI